MGITLNQLTNSVKKVKEYVEDTVNNKLDIAADFLSDNGFGNARCKSGVFEYYDKDNSVWKSSNNTPSRINISVKPQSMRKFTLAVDLENGGFRLKWLEPQDTIIDGQVVCTVDKVVIRRKKDSAPTSPTDGEEVITVDREQFGKYENKWFLDKSFSPVVGDIWYYKAFPFDDSEVYNNSVVNEKSLKYDTYVIYGFSIDQTESNPDSMIQYIDGCTNTEYEPAKMDFDNKVFDYGSWADAWFIKQCKPCMLKYDGTVDYYLDMNDYSKKEDGTDSDITNDAYEGNAMIEFPKVYVKLEPELGNEDKINIYISNTKIDKNYHCYAHLDGQENEMDYTYMSIYCGALVGNKLRSISGKAFAYGKAETLITAAKLNNLEGDDIWNIETFSDRFLLMLLLTMMCKTTMTQLSYGTGRHTASSKAWKTGLGDKQGFFYGKIGNSESTSDTLKTFGLENLWGNHRRYVVGLIKDANGMQKVKMYKTDGDSSDYNLTGEGYHEIGILSINSQQYVKKFYLNNEMCFLPKEGGGASNTYYSSYGFTYTGLSIGLFGCTEASKATNRLWTILYGDINGSVWSHAAALTCKPLVNKEA